ncbi:phage head morphogenesis protein [Basilea psittacipulmonis]|nr:phage head morphogenesis protein [Basilea psittacipulmonis]
MHEALQDNVSLISSIASKYYDDIEKHVNKAVLNGTLNRDLSKIIQERYDVSKSRANLIARDQSAKLNSTLSQAQAQACGVTQYRWHTSKDSRVRESHAVLDGKVFSYDNPPSVGNPGQDFQCRCVALPIFTNLFEKEQEAQQQASTFERLMTKSDYAIALQHFQKPHIQQAMASMNLTHEEAFAISAYTGQFAKVLNESLRKGEFNVYTKHFVKHLNSGLDKAPIYNKVTYRTVKLTQEEINRYKIGSIIEEKQFISTSKLNENVGFHGNVRYEIRGKDGREIENLSQYPHEQEVLFKTNRRFLVNDVKVRGKLRIIEMTEVD